MNPFRQKLNKLSDGFKQFKSDLKELDSPRVHEHEFLPAALEIQQKPAPALARGVIYTLCIFFVLTVLWAVLGTIDIVAVAQGKIIPSGGVKVIQPLETSVIQHIHVQNGQKVKAGDILIELDATAAGADQQRISYDLMVTRMALLRLQSLIADKPFRLSIDEYPEDVIALQNSSYLTEKDEYASRIAAMRGIISQREADYAAIQENIERLTQTLPLVSKRAEMLSELAEKGYSSRLNALTVEEQRVTTESELRSQRDRLRESAGALEAAKKELATVQAEWRKNILVQIHDLEQKRSGFEKELEKAARREILYQLRAPIDGTVQEMVMHTVGGVVTPAQELMKVVPYEATLEAEVMIQNKDIGFIEQGQEVEIKIDAFPFTKYGLIDGILTSLSMDAAKLDEGVFAFPARLSLEQAYLNVNGKDVPLKPGMTVTAEVRTGKRRIIEYFLSPIMTYASESIRER